MYFNVREIKETKEKYLLKWILCWNL